MYYITRVLKNGAAYVMDTDDGVEERVSHRDLEKLYDSGVEIKGVTASKWGYLDVEPYIPVSKESAKSLLTKGVSSSVINGHLKSLRRKGNTSMQLRLSDYAEYIDAGSLIPDDIENATVVVDKRIKKFDYRAITFTRDTDFTLVLAEDALESVVESVYKSKAYLGVLKPYHIADLSLQDREECYLHEALVLYSKISYKFFTPKSSAFFDSRNKSKLTARIRSAWTTAAPRVSFKYDKHYGAVSYDKTETLISMLKHPDTMDYSFISNQLMYEFNCYRMFIVKDDIVRSYVVAGGTNAEVLYMYAKLFYNLSECFYKVIALLNAGFAYSSLFKDSSGFFGAVERAYSGKQQVLRSFDSL